MRDFHECLQKWDFKVSQDQQQKIFDFLRLIQKWNKVFNLTALTLFEDMLVQHVLDSLAISPFLQEGDVLDVGTGAGLPGIPLAIVNPDKLFTLLDSNSKKTHFLLQVKALLKLDNVNVVHSRAEDFLAESCYSNVVSRAVATSDRIIRSTQHIICKDGLWLLMKAHLDQEELKGLDERLCEIKQIDIPGFTRHCLIVRA